MYLGGRETNKHETKKTKGTQGGAKTKTPVFGMTMKWKTEDVDTVTGEVKEMTHTYEVAKKVSDTKASTIIPIIRHFVADGSTIVTDESSIYNGLDAFYNHVFVCHSEKEFTVGSFTTNGIEGFWGHFKRVIFGTYHFVSKAYLERYIDEAVYRFNTKEMKEADRFSYMFEKAIGKVQYKDVKMVA
jgi:transposase-like protein